MATDSGYSNQKKLGISQFETVQNLGSDKYGKNVAVKSLYEIMPAAAIVSVSSIVGDSGQVKYWNIEITAHGAVVGNVLRMVTGTLINAEFEIMQVIDVDNVYVLPITATLPIVAETAEIMGWVTQKLSAAGEQNVSITTPPTSFEYNGAPQTVIQDTTTEANNRALPNLTFIYKDGVQVPITKDTGLPSNTIPMPVEIVAASGTPINITAGDLNVQLSDQGVNADVVRIGDGTTQLGITVANEAKVHDADVKTELQGIKTVIGAVADISEPDPTQSATVIQALKGVNENLVANLPSIFNGISALTLLIEDVNAPAGSVAGIKTFAEDELGNLQTFKAKNTGELFVYDAAALTALASLLTELQLKADLSETQPVSAASLPLPTGASTEATVAAILVESGFTNTKLDTIISNTDLPVLFNDETQDGIDNLTAVTFTAPVGAKKMIIANNASAVAANRIRFTAAANAPSWSTPRGQILGVGSFTSEIPAGDFKVIAEDASATAEVSVTWF